MYIGGENLTEALFLNLTEDLRIFENVKSVTRWRNSRTLSWLFTNGEFLNYNLSVLEVDWDVPPQLDVDAYWDFLLHMILCATK